MALRGSVYATGGYCLHVFCIYIAPLLHRQNVARAVEMPSGLERCEAFLAGTLKAPLKRLLSQLDIRRALGKKIKRRGAGKGEGQLLEIEAEWVRWCVFAVKTAPSTF